MSNSTLDAYNDFWAKASSTVANPLATQYVIHTYRELKEITKGQNIHQSN